MAHTHQAHHAHPPLAVDTHTSQSHPYWHEVRTLGSHPHRRSYHAAVSIGNRMIISGGQDLREGMVPGLWSFTLHDSKPELDAWEELTATENAPSLLCRHTAVTDGESMVLFGGTDNTTESDLAYAMDIRTLAWRVIPPTAPGLPPPIDSHSAVAYSGKMVVFGGFIGGSRSNTVFVLDLATGTWSAPEAGGSLPTPRSGHSAIVLQDKMIVFGGCNDDGNRLGDLWKLDLQSYAWEQLTPTGQIPEGRSGHSALLYKSVMIVFGGMKDLTKETNEMYGLKLDTMQWELLQEERMIEDPVSAVQLEEYKKGRSPHLKHSGPSSPLTGSPPKSRKDKDSPSSPSDPDSPGTKKKRGTGAPHLYDGPPSPLLGRIVGRAPYPRDGHSAVLVENKMMIFGGDRYQMPFNDLYIFAVNDHSVRLRT